MGKINQGILGGVSGQIGNVIGGTWKGIDYLRIKPSSVEPQNRRAGRSTLKVCRASFPTTNDRLFACWF